MKGLFLKDIINLKQQSKLYLIIIALWVAMSYSDSQPGYIGGMMLMFAVLIPLTAMSYDEKAKWARYAMTMPVSRMDMVLSKYLLAFCVGIAGQIVALVNDILLHHGEVAECLSVAFTMLSLGMIFVSVILPLMFKFGVEKGRFVIIIAMLVPTLLIMLLPRLGLAMPSEGAINSAVRLVPFIAILAVAASVLISKGIYDKKEF